MGSDGPCSTSAVNVLIAVGCAAALSKVRGDDYSSWLTAKEALAAATMGGARSLGFGNALAVLQVGALADLAAYRMDTVTFTPLNDPVRQLVYAERGAGLDFAMIAGAVAMRYHALTLIDESRILAEINTEMSSLDAMLAAGERSGAELRDAMAAVYRWSLTQDIAADTYPPGYAEHPIDAVAGQQSVPRQREALGMTRGYCGDRAAQPVRLPRPSRLISARERLPP